MDTNLREQILSEENIYKAIFAVESYISERNLLSASDLDVFLRLRDKYDFNGIISTVIEDCKKTLTKLLDNENELLEINIFFKIKKLSSEENPVVEYRPLHTASLVNQICMASMLMPLMFDDSNGKRNLSELSRMLPHNFYGNIPSCNVGSIFMNWTEKYRQYSQIVTNCCREYAKTREYDKEISFDLKDFFPSINPLKILNYIWNAVSGKYKNDTDKKCLKTIISKLLYFRIPEGNLEGWKDVYYKGQGDLIKPINGFYPSRGIAQGLPQSYFFGNLCMIEVAEIMSHFEELTGSDSYFYVDDSVVFAKNIDTNLFGKLIEKLNDSVTKTPQKWEEYPVLGQELLSQAMDISYNIQFHPNGKSTICDIKDSFKGMDGLFLVQRPVSMGGWIKGNIDEVDDNVALKKLTALQTVVDTEIKKLLSKKNSLKDNSYGEERLKWLRRYKRYFLFRQRRLQILLNGKYDEELKSDFFKKFRIEEITSQRKPSKELINYIFEIFEEEIFKSEFELILSDMPQEERYDFCKKIQQYDIALSRYNCKIHRSDKYLYYHNISSMLCCTAVVTVSEYESLSRVVRSVRPFRNSERFIEAIKHTSYATDDVWKLFPFLNPITGVSNSGHSYPNLKTEFPSWCEFVFRNSENFKRKILNCIFSYACNIQSGDNLSILRTDIKPIKYYELRIISMLRNYRLKVCDFFEFVRTLDSTDLNEKMDIDLGILEGLGIYRQKIQKPEEIDRLIQTHRLVKSLWHNGSKFLNAYTLHNHEHAINLIKNVVRLVNNVDFLNLKANDFFLLFNACYLHDISMVIHPNVASFNDSNTKSELLISKWLKRMLAFNEKIDHAYKSDKFTMSEIHQIRKEMGLSLIEAFQDIFDFFENRVRAPHAYESAKFIRHWQEGMLSFLSELETETIATISDSHGWDTTDVYEMKSSAKEELVSLKYMMILIRLADLLDLANDRIDYFLLKQNRSQMSSVSRYHWISHLITERYELDVDYDTTNEKDLTDQPIHELIHLDIFLNAEILANMEVHKDRCKGFQAELTKHRKNKIPKNDTEYECIEFKVGKDDDLCSSNMCKPNVGSRSCPFLCLWMSDRHWWLLSELGKLKHYLNSVNSKLIKSDISVRFFYNNNHKLDSEFFDDVKYHLIK